MTDEDSSVHLTWLEEEHIARYLPLSDDPVLLETMGWKPFEHDEKDRFLNYVENITVPFLMGGRTVALSIVSNKDDTPIGYLSIKGVREGGTGAELGLAIMDKDYRRQGLGTEAIRQAARYAFQELELSVLVLTVFPANESAIRAYEKVGFRKAELLKESWLMPDDT